MKVTDKQKILFDDGTSIDYFGPQDFRIVVPAIGVGAFASVYAASWKITRSMFAIKKFTGCLTKEKDVENEIRLMEMMNFHPNIIKFWGVTKFAGCWEHEQDKRPDIDRVILELNDIDTASNLLSSRFNPVNNNNILPPKKVTEYDDFSDCDLSKLELD
ncbi:hypothetical protein RhiirA4_418831 [Rhizophagus irregularis]|uniref:Protein kinase domain-containing protein n=1 Tax=Rhizophagus irregularis TaxID=588596 RepID=A0A2I1GC29_9GLOM|nr:hypothetical protein RhiirA4_418831 [Rhizophagus irregularis]